MSFAANLSQNGNNNGNSFQPMSLMSESFAFAEDDEEQIENKQDGKDEEEDSQTSDVDVELDEQAQELDPVSQVPLIRLESAPIPNDSLSEYNKTRSLKFIQNPRCSTGIAYTTGQPVSDNNSSGAKKLQAYEQDLTLYPTTTTTLTSQPTPAYLNYIRNMYQIYEDLADFKTYGVGSIGLIRHGVSREQAVKLKEAMDLIKVALSEYIEQESEDEIRSFELEEVMNVLNCVSFMFFLNNEDYQQDSYVDAVKEWVNFADPQPDSELNDDIFSQEKPFEHPLFWSFIQKLLLRGLLDQACSALEASGIIAHYKSCDMEVHDILFDLKDLIQTYPFNSSLEYFKSWKALTVEAYENSKRLISTSHPQELTHAIQSTFQLISGAKHHILDTAKTWYEAYLALLLYQHPSQSLHTEYLDLVSTKHTADMNSLWEISCSALMRGDKILEAIRCVSCLDSTTASYLSVVLEAKGLLNGYLDYEQNQFESDLFSTEGNKISEYFMNQHALSCLSEPELFPLGVGLLTGSTNSHARQVISEVLPHYDFQTDDDLEWMLTVCAKLRLPDTAQKIYRIAGQRALADARVYDALVLLGKAGDVSAVKKYALLVMERCLLSQGRDQDEFINELIDTNALESGLIRQVIAPYVILRQYFSYLSSGDVRPAMSKLLRLLGFPYLPTEYVSLLLVELLKILVVYQRTVMTKGETFQLISVLDQYEETLSKQEKLRTIAQQYFEISKKLSSDSELNWVEQFEKIGINVPVEVEGVVKLVRGVVAGVLAKLFLEGKKE
ncbi:hypothetical protein WICPIJ_001393 [Wickerhamomyces pijperi]|uniref:Nuclear pore complex protein Nup85 n=1 Tax=Wickerhamomyces pijperi TaxID=599730 RepID=A0A9P8QBR9_WICPI|nr:hypothetical protein WICPIJ_001393 [Wickerhamomyces pijperi]